jgi:hypothetical protein
MKRHGICCLMHGMRNARDGAASCFVLRWTSPGKQGPKAGGSR